MDAVKRGRMQMITQRDIELAKEMGERFNWTEKIDFTNVSDTSEEDHQLQFTHQLPLN